MAQGRQDDPLLTGAVIPWFVPKYSQAEASLNGATTLSEPQPCSW